MVGNKRIYLKTFKKINMSAPQEEPNKRLAADILNMPTPFAMPSKIDKSKSEETEICNKIDLSKFDFKNIDTKKVHVDDS